MSSGVISLFLAASIMLLMTQTARADDRLRYLETDYHLKHISVWVPMLELCMQYVETGKKRVFGGLDVIGADGKPCGDGASCASHRLSFVGSGVAEFLGVSIVGRPGSPIVDEPERVTCTEPRFSHHMMEWVGAVQDAFLDLAVEKGRLRRIEEQTYVGCGWNHQAYALRLSTATGSSNGRARFTVQFPARGFKNCKELAL